MVCQIILDQSSSIIHKNKNIPCPLNLLMISRNTCFCNLREASFSIRSGIYKLSRNHHIPSVIVYSSVNLALIFIVLQRNSYSNYFFSINNINDYFAVKKAQILSHGRAL